MYHHQQRQLQHRLHATRKTNSSTSKSSTTSSRSMFAAGRSSRDQIFFLLRTALKDRPKGPPIVNHQPPPTAANRRQPPTAANRQPRPTANRQPLPTATNHPSPTANCRQPPPTAANHQPPTANRQSPPAANRQSPPTMVEHMSYTRSFLKKPCSGTVFFFPVKDRPGLPQEETGFSVYTTLHRNHRFGWLVCCLFLLL